MSPKLTLRWILSLVLVCLGLLHLMGRPTASRGLHHRDERQGKKGGGRRMGPKVEHHKLVFSKQGLRAAIDPDAAAHEKGADPHYIGVDPDSDEFKSWNPEVSARDRMHDLFPEVDTNRDNAINKEEALSYLLMKRDERRLEHASWEWRFYNHDGDDKLTWEEYESKMGSHHWAHDSFHDYDDTDDSWWLEDEDHDYHHDGHPDSDRHHDHHDTVGHHASDDSHVHEMDKHHHHIHSNGHHMADHYGDHEHDPHHDHHLDHHFDATESPGYAEHMKREKEQQKELFGICDKNGDGVLSFEEFTTFEEPFDSSDKAVQLLLVKRRFEHCDKDGSGGLSQEEFLAHMWVDMLLGSAEQLWLEEHWSEEQEQEMGISTFKRLDADKDGKLQLDEVSVAVDQLQPGHVATFQQAVEEVFEAADANKDGMLTLNEALHSHDVFYHLDHGVHDYDDEPWDHWRDEL